MNEKQTIPSWFKGNIYEKGAVVTNRFSKEEYELNAEELSMYDFVMGEVEPELLIATMRFAKNNQSKAAKYLGLNRATLRKKLLKYKIHSDL